MIYGGAGSDTLSSAGGHSTTFRIEGTDQGLGVITNFHTHNAFGSIGDYVLSYSLPVHSLALLEATGLARDTGTGDVSISDSTHIVLILKGLSLAVLSEADFLI